MADLHLGVHNNKKLRKLELESIKKAVKICLEENIDFLLISGDIFDSNIPDLNQIAPEIEEFRKLVERGISIYVIPGSHDRSTGQKSLMDVINATGFFIKADKAYYNEEDKVILKFTEDIRTGVKIAGVGGKITGKDRQIFQDLDRDYLESIDGFKILMFHHALDELKPYKLNKMESVPRGVLPKGFDYYAAGHIHQVIIEKSEDYPLIQYPGPLFSGRPKDLEYAAKQDPDKFQGFFVLTYDGKELTSEFKPLKVCEYIFEQINPRDGPITVDELNNQLENLTEKHDVHNKIFLLRIACILSSGKTSEVNLRKFRETLMNKGAYFVNINRNSLIARKQRLVKGNNASKDDIEKSVFMENLKNVDYGDDNLIGTKGIETAMTLLNVLKEEKKANEKKADYEERMLNSGREILKIEND